MKKILLYGSWVCVYAVCALLGALVAEPEGVRRLIVIFFSLLFFVPPAILLVDARKAQEEKTLQVLRCISGASLALTMLLLVGNVLSALGSEALGTVLYWLLLFVSVPMICSQHWFLSLFLWACIFFCTLPKKKNS